MPADDVVFDTTCLLYMAATGHDDLLEQRYRGRAYVPTEVVAELERGEAAHGFNCGRFLAAAWWTPVPIDDPADHAEFFSLARAAYTS